MDTKKYQLLPCDMDGYEVAKGDTIKIGRSGKQLYKIISMDYDDKEDEIYYELKNLKNGRTYTRTTQEIVGIDTEER